MEYQKIVNLLDNLSSRPSKFRTNEFNIRTGFETLMLKSS